MEGALYTRMKAKGSVVLNQKLQEGVAVVIVEQTLFSSEDGSILPERSIKNIDTKLVDERIAYLQQEIDGYNEMRADIVAFKLANGIT